MFNNNQYRGVSLIGTANWERSARYSFLNKSIHDTNSFFPFFLSIALRLLPFAVTCCSGYFGRIWCKFPFFRKRKPSLV